MKSIIFFVFLTFLLSSAIAEARVNVSDGDLKFARNYALSSLDDGQKSESVASDQKITITILETVEDNCRSFRETIESRSGDIEREMNYTACPYEGSWIVQGSREEQDLVASRRREAERVARVQERCRTHSSTTSQSVNLQTLAYGISARNSSLIIRALLSASPRSFKSTNCY